MIKSKEDLKYYIDADLKSRFGENYKLSIINRISAIFIPYPWKFQILLRKAEFYCNSDKKIIKKILGNIYKIRAYKYGAKCGYSVPINVFGPGLFLAHIGTIVINGGAKFGSNARIQACVNVGAFSKFDENWSENTAPKFGDNIYIGPGAKIFGDIQIGDNVAIGANAVISKSIPGHCTVVSVNKVVNEKGSIDMIRYGDALKIPEDSYIFKQKQNQNQLNIRRFK